MLAGSLVLTLAPRPTVVTAAPAAPAVQSDATQAPEAVFTNSAPITIPAVGNGSPYPSTINVSGLSGTIPATPGAVKVTFNGFNHTFADDLGIVLVGPTGAALLVLDGASEDVTPTVTFTIADTGATPIPDVDPITAGTFKPAAYFTGDSFPAPGPGTTYNHPGPAGGNTATFSSTFTGTNPNGNWNLFIVDFVSGDGGGLAGGWSLEITTGVAPPTGCTTAKRPLDFDGNGSTDFTVVRNIGGGPSGQIAWFTQLNGAAGNTATPWGIATDDWAPGDYDNDGKADVGIWRSAGGGGSAFYILQSATNTISSTNFGQPGDDPSVVGDYDGDGKTDLAVYRPGAASGDHSFWLYRSSLTSNVVSVEWGQNGDFPAPGDYDGDGKNDFVVQRNNGGGQAGFHLLLSAGGSSGVVFGTPTDVIVPGYWDNDCKTDIATVRGSGGLILWNYRKSTDGSIVQQVWGNSATDFPTQGDYDGDGFTDFAVWRPSADPSQNFFFMLRSSTGTLSAQEWGQNGDYPIANYNTH